ncbi:hypothetical protein [Streptomyces alanosinicus]|uniref:Uncharacterized protein n=1 Tax=Streptomyces alanosinicus TaxID=68171 RepID=A0A918YNW7_9ACTN|nr:hypothetical protein [Streptomyces alanosinicus]GHE09573.1 hypothetical protein GCM10010339_62330 [Streptomyces alanosinicus]
MQSIEFLNYPVGDQLSDAQWGFRVDGKDLRVYAADATRDLWRQERENAGLAEEEDFLLNQHGGLTLSEVGDPARHFLGDPAPEFVDPSTGAVPLLGCSCGIWGCWPLLATINTTPDTVTWSCFRQPFRKEWGELAMGPHVFARSAYEAALAEPIRLASDPLQSPHPRPRTKRLRQK